jgi:endonuclease-3
MAEKNRAAKVLNILKETSPLPTWTKLRQDPFATLVTTIISQNTADRNTASAIDELSKHFEIRVEALAKAKICNIEAAIKSSGLYKAKARSIKQAATEIQEKYCGTLEPILSLPLEEARNSLMQFRGVGPKTADVVLLFSAKKETIPVDTHVYRVSKRLGFAPENGGYEVVRSSLQSLFSPKDYLAVHILLIAHGRKTCRAQHPVCKQCRVKTFCPSNGLWEKS